MSVNNNSFPNTYDVNNNPSQGTNPGTQPGGLPSVTQDDYFEKIRPFIENNLLKRSQMTTAFFSANYKGNKETVELLLQKGMNPNISDWEGNSPLYIATIYGRTEIARLLIQNKANVNTAKEGMTVLSQATLQGNKELVELLISHNADLSSVTVKGPEMSALVEAAVEGNAELVQLLLDRGVKKITDFEVAVDFVIRQTMKNREYRKMYSILFDVPLDETFMRHVKQRIQTNSVAHSCEIEAKSSTFYPTDETKPITTRIPIDSPYWIKKMISVTKHFKEMYPDLSSNTNLLEETLSFTLDNFQDPSKFLERIQSKKSTILISGFNGHAVAILMQEPYFVLCNTSAKPVEILLLDSSKLDLALLTEIFGTNRTEKAYEELIVKMLYKGVIKFEEKKDNNVSSALSSCSPIKKQNVSNCSYASLEAVVWAFFALNRIWDEEKAQSFISKDLIQIIEQENSRFFSWQIFNRAYDIEKYLGARVIRPYKDKQKTLVYKLDNLFIKHAFSNVIPHVDERILDLLGKLKANFEQQYQSNRKIFI